MLPHERLHEVVRDALIEVLATKMRVTSRGKHLKDAMIDGQHRHIERTAAQVEHNDVLLVFLVEAVGDGSRRGLVDDAEDVQARDRTRVLRRLPLRIVEVGRDSDHSILDLLTKIVLRDVLHLG